MSAEPGPFDFIEDEIEDESLGAPVEKRSGNVAESLARISQMADVLKIRQAAVAKAEAELERVQAELRQVEEEDFPLLMKELELQELALADGRKIKLEAVLSCSITEANKSRAYQWLRDRKFGSIIKSVLSLQFDRGRDEEMLAAMKSIEEATGMKPEASQGIHAQTLKSFIKERRAAAGADGEKSDSWPPEDLFGIFVKDKVSVKLPR